VKTGLDLNISPFLDVIASQFCRHASARCLPATGSSDARFKLDKSIAPMRDNANPDKLKFFFFAYILRYDYRFDMGNKLLTWDSRLTQVIGARG